MTGKLAPTATEVDPRNENAAGSLQDASCHAYWSQARQGESGPQTHKLRVDRVSGLAARPVRILAQGTLHMVTGSCNTQACFDCFHMPACVTYSTQAGRH